MPVPKRLWLLEKEAEEEKKESGRQEEDLWPVKVSGEELSGQTDGVMGR